MVEDIFLRVGFTVNLLVYNRARTPSSALEVGSAAKRVMYMDPIVETLMTNPSVTSNSPEENDFEWVVECGGEVLGNIEPLHVRVYWVHIACRDSKGFYEREKRTILRLVIELIIRT